MGINLRLPNITGTTDRERIAQLTSFLYQTVEQLNFAMDSLDTGTTSTVERYISKNSLLEKNGSSAIDAPATFNAIKGLIIKSADIVSAYYEELSRKFNSEYFAESDFGTFLEVTEQTITANSEAITQNFTNIQEISTDLNGKEGLKKQVSSNTAYRLNTDAYIKSGEVAVEIREDGTERVIYGIQIGQTAKVNGEEVFNKFARFTADMLAFYDPLRSTEDPIAWISGRKLHIPNAEITISLQIGGFLEEIQTNGDVVTKWVGRG